MLFLTACGIPPLRQADPGPPLPVAFQTYQQDYTPALAAVVGGPGFVPPIIIPTVQANNAAANSYLAGLADFYNDDKLLQLIEQALAGNLELKMLNQEVEIARNEVMTWRGSYLPFVNVGSRAGFFKSSYFTPEGAAEDQLLTPKGRHFPYLVGNFGGGFDIFWQLDIWRQLRNARDAAIQRFIAAQERRNTFVTRLVAEVAENYYHLMALDQRIATLDQVIALQQQSYEFARLNKETGRGTELPVQRFLAEVRKNQSFKQLLQQEIIERENRINFLLNRYPQPVERQSTRFYELDWPMLAVGIPPQLLQNRPDIRQAERELLAAGLDVLVARAKFFPTVALTANVGYEAFNPRYLFNPEALVLNLAGNLTAPLINKLAIRAEYLTANAKQLQSVYNYQRVVLNAFTEVVNYMVMVQQFGKSVEIRKQQLKALEASVDIATKLFQAARVEYIEVLFAQRDLLDARLELIETKMQQLSAIVNLYRALGGGDLLRLPYQPYWQRTP
ncbi:MAG: efflux transporter outer membrane subunit [Thermogemmata sp.]|nr:efflux transporter outer membrane subunit [Thermogemmata sp.]